MFTTCERLMGQLIDRWRSADAMDFGALALTIIVAAWFLNHYCND
jgi:hypothetical protein